MAFTMRSKYNSTCRECGFRIHIGDDIEKRNGAWVHVVCPDGLMVRGDMGGSSNTATLSIEDAISSAENRVPFQDEESVISVVAEPLKPFVPSKYQQAIFDFVTSGKGNGVVEAVAGSGKTTTLVKILDIVPENQRTIYLAFNRHIAVELRRRAPKHVQVSTIHALGLNVIKRVLNNHVRIENDKVGEKMDDIFPVARDTMPDFLTRAANRNKRSIMRRMVSLAKGTLFDYTNREAILENAERYGIDLNGSEDDIVSNLPVIMQRCLEDTDTIDFDDMVWMPIANKQLKLFIDKFEFVLVDEAQDLNAAQIEFVLQTLSPIGRIIAVGDRNQSLYGFRGADVEAIPRLIKMLSAQTLPLSISYRCPRKHVQLAQNIVPQIEASETAKEGEITQLPMSQLMDTLQVNDMVVCRTNAPLIEPAFAVIRSGKKAMIRGADIGKQLIQFVERFDAQDLSQLEARMQEYTEKEYQRLLDKGKELQAEMLMDKMETVMSVVNESRTVEEVVYKIETLFSDTNEGVVFSSIHRAKGLEAQRVFILHPELIPHPKAVKEWEQQQEMNCLYVAVTRSLEQLYFVRENV